ncbi:MAG: 16S rRNA (guanine(527)-N(7))-methyltransferase RsmG [Proteobacteria bacterium]|nr:16S rRNA (guanine(527)-N(7))-methyltransferase RsmG [Pseudomonadota bacterium]
MTGSSNNSDQEIKNRIESEFNVSRETIHRLERYTELLKTWQSKINLIGPGTVEIIWHRHILDSLQLVPFLPSEANSIADLGSGAGFPGLVLSIATGLPVDLIESTGRKAAFLRTVARETDANVTVRNCRIEDVPTSDRWSVITARGCASLTNLLSYAEPLIERGGTCLFLKGGKWREELTESLKSWNISSMEENSLTDDAGTILKVTKFSRRHDHI